MVGAGGLAEPFLSSSAVAAAKPLASVPFRFIRNEIIAAVRINGKGPFAVLLDTGTAPSVIDTSVAREIGLKLRSTTGDTSGGGTQTHETFTTELDEVRFGTYKVKNVVSLTTDLSGLTRELGQPIAAVLGDSFFSNRVVQFDYREHVASLFSTSPILKGQKTKKTFIVPFKHEDGEVHFAGLKINGESVQANLDTGSNGDFSLTPKAIIRLGLAERAKTAQIRSGAGFNGKYKAREGTLDLVQLGDYQRRKAPVLYWAIGTGHDASDWDVNVGNAFLRDFLVTVDYRANLLTLVRY